MKITECWPFIYINKVSYFSIMLRFEKTSFHGFIDPKHDFENIHFVKVTFRNFTVRYFSSWRNIFFEIVGYDNISIKVFMFSRKNVCAVLSFLKMYIRDFIRAKKNSFRWYCNIANIFSAMITTLSSLIEFIRQVVKIFNHTMASPLKLTIWNAS